MRVNPFDTAYSSPAACTVDLPPLNSAPLQSYVTEKLGSISVVLSSAMVSI